MALKEFRGSDGKAAQGKARKDLEGKKTPGGGIDNGEALLEVLLGEDLTGLMERLKVFVAPLQAIRGKETSSRTMLHKIAKQIVPFLVPFLVHCCHFLAKLLFLAQSSTRKNPSPPKKNLPSIVCILQCVHFHYS